MRGVFGSMVDEGDGGGMQKGGVNIET